MKKYVMVCVLVTSLVASCAAYGQTAVETTPVMEGTSNVVKANDAYNINPYNIATITGVGEGNAFRLVDTYQTFDIPLKAPLYRVSDAYKDKILQKDGVWGVERNVTVKIFDGSEDWSMLPNPGYRNDNTTIFVCSNESPAIVREGLCTHFDVFTDDDQKNNIYDGISFGRTTSEFYMRIMNVRNVTTVDALKAYLKAQYDAGTPVKFFFASPESRFEPFDEEIQEKMKQIDLKTIGFIDRNLEKMTVLEAPEINNKFFNQASGDVKMDSFLSAITDIKILQSSTDRRYSVTDVHHTDDGFGITIKEENSGAVFYGTLETKESNYTSNKPAELTLTSEAFPETIIKIQMDLTKVKFPVEDITGFTYPQTGIKDSCIVNKELVLTDYVPVVKGLETGVYLENTILNGFSKQKETILVPEIGNGIEFMNNILSGKNVAEETSISMSLGDTGEVYETNWIPVEESAGQGQERVVLFLGDSLLNQDIYTQQIVDLFQEDPMKVKLIGTRGTEGAAHEGRGGWSAYDYCNVETKYGFTNPFLLDGEFNFAHYMQTNEYEHVDNVIINLGINDLNLAGHNSHQEIIGNFDKILKSIHSYDPTIAVMFNTPTMLYGEAKTDTAKDARLSFIKTLKDTYGHREDEGIFVIPIYLGVDPYMGFKLTNPIIDEYNQDYSLIVTDTTHPSNRGYRAMAEMTYSFLKYVAAKQ